MISSVLVMKNEGNKKKKERKGKWYHSMNCSVFKFKITASSFTAVPHHIIKVHRVSVLCPSSWNITGKAHIHTLLVFCLMPLQRFFLSSKALTHFHCVRLYIGPSFLVSFLVLHNWGFSQIGYNNATAGKEKKAWRPGQKKYIRMSYDMALQYKFRNVLDDMLNKLGDNCFFFKDTWTN